MHSENPRHRHGIPVAVSTDEFKGDQHAERRSVNLRSKFKIPLSKCHFIVNARLAVI